MPLWIILMFLGTTQAQKPSIKPLLCNTVTEVPTHGEVKLLYVSSKEPSDDCMFLFEGIKDSVLELKVRSLTQNTTVAGEEDKCQNGSVNIYSYQANERIILLKRLCESGEEATVITDTNMGIITSTLGDGSISVTAKTSAVILANGAPQVLQPPIDGAQDWYSVGGPHHGQLSNHVDHGTTLLRDVPRGQDVAGHYTGFSSAYQLKINEQVAGGNGNKPVTEFRPSVPYPVHTYPAHSETLVDSYNPHPPGQNIFYPCYPPVCGGTYYPGKPSPEIELTTEGPTAGNPPKDTPGDWETTMTTTSATPMKLMGATKIEEETTEMNVASAKVEISAVEKQEHVESI